MTNPVLLSNNQGFEAKLWQTADALRNNMDAAEYKHVVLGLIFLKYISDAFEARHVELAAQQADGADPEDPDEYRGASIFWVPQEARWTFLRANAPQPEIGKLVDDAMTVIERDNPSLKGVLPKDYARPGLDKQRLGQLINLVSDIALGSAADRAKDKLGQVYEYFLAQFASAEGKKGGQFYTPSHVVHILVEMLAPYKGRVYDPCCGSGGMFVSSEKFIAAHQGRIGDISIYGQESNYTTWRLAKMNLAIRGIDAQIAHGDTFHNDQHPDLKADYVLAETSTLTAPGTLRMTSATRFAWSRMASIFCPWMSLVMVALGVPVLEDREMLIVSAPGTCAVCRVSQSMICWMLRVRYCLPTTFTETLAY